MCMHRAPRAASSALTGQRDCSTRLLVSAGAGEGRGMRVCVRPGWRAQTTIASRPRKVFVLRFAFGLKSLRLRFDAARS